MTPQDQTTPNANTQVIQFTTSYPPGTVPNEMPVAAAPCTSSSPDGSPSPAQLEALGTGTEGEVDVWMGHYSLKNFIPRVVVRVLLTVCWLALLLYLGERDHYPGNLSWNWFVGLTGGAIAVYWLMLGWVILLASLGHTYRLTNRRIFVDTGVFRHRRDQIELLRMQDVFVKQQRFLDRLMNVGTVVIESSEERLPVHYLPGVNDPNFVMDQLWHQARKERDLRSVKVDEV
jgi:membrane protein YdbS with pleckstrin-like domain